jgi:hypothetical protein
MSRLTRTGFGVIAALAFGVGPLPLLGHDTADARRTSQPLPQASQGRCPTLHAQQLPRRALAGATQAALDQARYLYRGTNLEGMRATRAALARNDPDRGGYARLKCGRRMQERTVVVYLEFPAMRPSASLSQGVVLVSRFAGQYRIWAQLH